MYAKYFKRMIDFLLSLFALIILFPIILLLTIIGAFAMKGNPFFTQARPGKDEKIFKLIKFRTMSCEKDKNGNLLPDDVRLNKYGRILRSTSLDELPELWNILKGDMSIVGPRPLLVKYLPYYTDAERKRHTVRPGLTGYAQVNGRNGLNWDLKLKMDLDYIQDITLINDIKIVLLTIKSVLKRDGISQEGQATMEDFVDYVNSKHANEQKEIMSNV